MQSRSDYHLINSNTLSSSPLQMKLFESKVYPEFYIGLNRDIEYTDLALKFKLQRSRADVNIWLIDVFIEFARSDITMMQLFENSEYHLKNFATFTCNYQGCKSETQRKEKKIKEMMSVMDSTSFITRLKSELKQFCNTLNYKILRHNENYCQTVVRILESPKTYREETLPLNKSNISKINHTITNLQEEIEHHQFLLQKEYDTAILSYLTNIEWKLPSDIIPFLPEETKESIENNLKKFTR